MLKFLKEGGGELVEKIRRYYPPALELIPLGLTVVTLLYVAYHFGRLPEDIPTHFDATGTPDGWGSRYMLIALPILQCFLYVQTFLFNYFLIIKPEPKETLNWINIPFIKKDQLGQEAVEKIKRQMARMMFSTNLGLVLLFAYVLVGTVQTAYGHWNGLGSQFIWFVILIALMPFYFMWKSYRAAKPKG